MGNNTVYSLTVRSELEISMNPSYVEPESYNFKGHLWEICSNL